MQQASLSLIALLFMLVLSCLPPAALLALALRRYSSVRSRLVRPFRAIIAGSAAILVVNLFISFLSPLQLSQEGLFQREHLLALGLSWVCFLGAIALLAIFPRRRRIIV